MNRFADDFAAAASGDLREQFGEPAVYYPAEGGTRNVTVIRTGNRTKQSRPEQQHRQNVKSVVLNVPKPSAVGALDGIDEPQLGDVIEFDGRHWSFDPEFETSETPVDYTCRFEASTLTHAGREHGL